MELPHGRAARSGEEHLPCVEAYPVAAVPSGPTELPVKTLAEGQTGSKWLLVEDDQDMEKVNFKTHSGQAPGQVEGATHEEDQCEAGCHAAAESLNWTCSKCHGTREAPGTQCNICLESFCECTRMMVDTRYWYVSRSGAFEERIYRSFCPDCKVLASGAF